MASLDRRTASILLCTIFRNLCTKLLESPLPQHTLLFPIQCFCSWHFTHQKNAFSLLSSVQMLSIPQDPDQSHSDKLSLVIAIWNDLPTFLTPTMFTIYAVLKVWLWDHQLQKYTIICIFRNTRKSYGNFPTVFTNYFATLRRLTHPHMHGEGKADKAYRCWSDQLIHLNYSFLYSFSQKKFWFVNCVFVRSVMSLLTAEFTIIKPPPLCFLILASQFHAHSTDLKIQTLLPFSK